MSDKGENDSTEQPEGVLGLARPNHYGERSDLAVIRRAVEHEWNGKNWNEKDVLRRAFTKAASIMQDSPHERNSLAAIQAIQSLVRFRFDAACKLNEIYRHERMTDDIAGRIAEDIRNRPPVATPPPPGAVPTGNGNGKVQGRTGGSANGQDHDR